MAVLADLETALADPALDAVVLATPNQTHAPFALQALAAGKHVLVDKPFALDAAQAREVVQAAAAAGRIVSVFQNRRWDADFLTVRRLIDEGQLGEVVEFHSHFDRYRPQVRERWRESDIPGAGLWYDLGPHLLDQALHLFGTPQAIGADLQRQRSQARSDDYFHVTLRYPRLRVMLHAGSLVADSSLRSQCTAPVAVISSTGWIRRKTSCAPDVARAPPAGASTHSPAPSPAWMKKTAYIPINSTPCPATIVTATPPFAMRWPAPARRRSVAQTRCR